MRSTALITALAVTFLVGCKSGPTIPTETGIDPNDRDGDGFNQAQDCDDGDAEINPDADDMVGDGVDNNCDGIDGIDADEDGFASTESGGDDCDDTNNQYNPSVLDIGWNEIDEDCSGADRHDYKTIGVGNSVSCGVKSTDELVCWGNDTDGLITNTPTDGTDWTVLTGGDGWICGIDAGTIRCWGDDEFGVISGIPDIADSTGSAWQQLTAGRDHACAITNLGAGVCWGRDDYNQVTGVNNLVGFGLDAIAPGRDHTCVVLSSGFAQCFGLNDQEQATPRPLDGRFIQLSSGDNHTCGILDNQRLSCWGADRNGQINPLDLVGPYTYVSLANNSGCGILSATDVTCWGQGNFNQIFPPDRTAVQVEMGVTHACARNGVGLAFCWGDNSLGQTDIP